eukprot:m.30484 g.30484  ORF g.30484 m.30484 type:complete len:241 (+) comp31346_c0_seq1:109-831(+)
MADFHLRQHRLRDGNLQRTPSDENPASIRPPPPSIRLESPPGHLQCSGRVQNVRSISDGMSNGRMDSGSLRSRLPRRCVGTLDIHIWIVQIAGALGHSFHRIEKAATHLLHWYHHITVFCYCWWAYSAPHGQGRLFIAMNYFVHMIMYSYYATRAQGLVRLPPFVNIGITAVQIAQMCIGSWAFVDAALKIRNGVPCAVQKQHVVLGSVMYLSYLALFANFFYHSYIKKTKNTGSAIPSS